MYRYNWMCRWLGLYHRYDKVNNQWGVRVMEILNLLVYIGKCVIILLGIGLIAFVIYLWCKV